VAQDHGRTAGRRVAVAPLQELDDDRPQVHALVRQPVLVAQGPLAVRDLREDVLGDEALEARGEHVASHAQVALQRVEAAHPEEHVAQHEERPALADQLQRASDRAVLIAVVGPKHPISTISLLSCMKKRCCS
jgi:hypothetical protein